MFITSSFVCIAISIYAISLHVTSLLSPNINVTAVVSVCVAIGVNSLKSSKIPEVIQDLDAMVSTSMLARIFPLITTFNVDPLAAWAAALKSGPLSSITASSSTQATRLFHCRCPPSCFNALRSGDPTRAER